MDKITLSKAKQIASRIHSKYKEDSKPPTGNQNCQLCTWCAEAQFRGLDVLPRPIYSPRDPALEIKGETIVKAPTKIKIRNKDHIVSTVKDNPGSRYYIHVKWNGGSGGHEFLIINIDSNVYIMDAQQGLVESIDKTKYFDDVDYSGSYFARLDNKQLNRELLNKMNSMKTLVPWDWDKDVAYMKKHGMLGEDEDIRFIRYYVPSDKATEYLKQDPELKQYWEKLNKDTNGEILVDPNTKEQIGHGFVYNGNDKSNEGFIFNIEVMPKYRRQGIGTIILNDCVTKFGGRDLTVDCDNEAAVHMYLKYGFEIIDKGKYSDHGEGYYMRLKKSKAVQEGVDMITQESFIEEMLSGPFTDVDVAMNVMYIMEEEIANTKNNPTLIQRIIDWCRKAIEFIVGKIKAAFGKNSPVTTTTDVNGLNNTAAQVINSVNAHSGTNIEELTRTLNGFKNKPQTSIQSNDASIKQMQHNIAVINGLLKDTSNMSQQDIQALQKILAEYMEVMKSVSATGSGSEQVKNALLKSIQSNNAQGSNNITVYPFLYSRTFYNDFDPVAALRPNKFQLSELRKLIHPVVNGSGNVDTRGPAPSVSFYNGYYVIGLNTPANILAEQVGYKPEMFSVNGTQFKKYLQDKVGRHMMICVGYIISEDEITKNGIPSISYEMLWNIYINTQSHIYFEKDYNRTYQTSGSTSIKSNPLQNAQPTGESAMITQEFDPLKLYSAINKTKTEYRDKLINIGDFDRVPLNGATAEEYDEGHGQWITPLSRYNVDDDHFEGTILVDEHGICPGYLVIDNRPDGSKWILGVESSIDYKSFAIVAQLLYLARTEFDTKNAIAPKTNKALIECYLENGWTISDQNPHVVVLKYENDDEDDETDYEPDGVADVVTEYMIMELSKNTLMFHVSDQKNLDGQVFRPRVPEYIDPYDPTDTGFENDTTPRVCFSPTIDGALNAVTVQVQPTNPVAFDKMYVYIPEKPFNQYKHKTNKEIIRDKDVYDANVTGEAWILEPVRLRLYGVIQVDQNRKVKRKKTVATSENKRGDRNVFSYRWHWLVKPKVISSTVGKVKYDAMAVCDMIARELYQFKYGLCVDGRKKSNTTEADWDKYWRLQSPEQFEQSRVGNCYDFVEWEAGFLDAYYVKYKKYYISALYKNKLATHTFIVVPDNGKYIYLEGAFKRVADEIHHMKVFDKLEDIFEYIVECMVEFENVPEFDYGVWDYTDNGIKPGTDMKHFQEDITKGDPIHEGNVKRKKE